VAKIVDLSKLIYDNPNDPFFMRVKIDNRAHKKSHALIRFFLKLPKRLFGETFFGWADDTITQMGVHSTTHIDAPYHYSPTTEGGVRSKTIDEMPLEWGYGDGIVLDFSAKDELDPITLQDITSKVAESGVTIKEGTIVLIRTDRDKYIGTKEYPERGTGMSGEATRWLIEQGVRVMGIDQWGWDLPLNHQVKLAKEQNSPEIFWEGHRVGAELEYFHMEQLVNLSALPSDGFKVAVFPLKIKGASAAPARVVAIFDDE